MMKRDSRGLILGAARSEFAEAGYSGSRVERIARRAGVNKQLIFYYYGSKAGLYQAVLDGAAAQWAEPGAGHSARLKDALAVVFERLVQHPEGLAMLLDSARMGPRRAPSVVQALGTSWRQVRDTISTGQGVGLVRDDADPHVLALQAMVLLVGYLSLEPLLIEVTGPVTREAWLAAATETLTRTLAW
jgi:TetR/AcrR family transcriptional regulator